MGKIIRTHRQFARLRCGGHDDHLCNFFVLRTKQRLHRTGKKVAKMMAIARGEEIATAASQPAKPDESTDKQPNQSKFESQDQQFTFWNFNSSYAKKN